MYVKNTFVMYFFSKFSYCFVSTVHLFSYIFSYILSMYFPPPLFFYENFVRLLSSTTMYITCKCNPVVDSMVCKGTWYISIESRYSSFPILSFITRIKSNILKLYLYNSIVSTIYIHLIIFMALFVLFI